MAALLLTWLFLGFTAFGTGLGWLVRVDGQVPLRSREQWLLAPWVGILIYAITLLTLSLIVPLSLPIGILASVGLNVMAFSSAEVWHSFKRFLHTLSASTILLNGIGALIVAWLVSQPVTFTDTGLYHLGSLRWLNEHGTVPGVALIHARFGFISSWFALAAPFNGSVVNYRLSSVANGLVYWFASFHLYSGLYHVWQGQARLSDWFNCSWGCLTLPLFTSFGLITDLWVSPSPDAIVILILGVTAWSILVALDHTSVSPILFKAPLVLAIGAFSIKLSALPVVVVLALFYLKTYSTTWRTVLQGILVIGLGLIPTLWAGLIASGCPLYPSRLGCLPVAWQVRGFARVEHSVGIGGWWNHWLSSPPPDVNRVMWILQQWLTIDKNSSLFLGLGILGIGLVGVLGWVYRAKTPASLYWILGLGGGGMLFVWVQTPLLRFALGYGVLIPAIAIAMYWHQEGSLTGWSRITFTIVLAGSCLVAGWGLLRTQRQWYVWLPPAIETPLLSEEQVNDVRYRHPLDYGSDVCWAAEQPCSLGPISSHIWLKDPERSYRGGFVVKEEYTDN